jgi:uncharacterized tellurite resistance protein B-like protein
VSLLLRFLGLSAPSASASHSESPAIRRIAEALSGMPPERARFFAAFAYVLARVAGADLRVEENERERSRDIVMRLAEVDADTASVVVEIAHGQMHELGASANYLVTREFRRISTRDEQIRLLDCLFAVAAADDVISGRESQEIMIIAEEIGVPRVDALAIRSRFKDKLSELRKLSGET